MKQNKTKSGAVLDPVELSRSIAHWTTLRMVASGAQQVEDAEEHLRQLNKQVQQCEKHKR